METQDAAGLFTNHIRRLDFRPGLLKRVQDKPRLLLAEFIQHRFASQPSERRKTLHRRPPPDHQCLIILRDPFQPAGQPLV